MKALDNNENNEILEENAENQDELVLDEDIELDKDMNTKVTEEYDASQIQVLEGLEAVRKRPGMYIGSTGPRGLHHLVYEIVDNSIDEALAGFCTNIDVEILPGNVISVKDNGRGIPVGMNEKMGISTVTVVLTVLHAGGKFGGNGYKVSGGLHGVGASVVNALSEWLTVQVHKNGNIYEMKFSRGKITQEMTIIGSTDHTGTTVTFKPDPEMFEELEYSYETLHTRMREEAFLNAGLRITIEDKRLESKEKPESERRDSMCYEGGIREFVTWLNKKKEPLHNNVIYMSGMKGDSFAELALQYDDGYQENILSFANNVHTPEGGMHETGFKAALTRVLNAYGIKNGIIKEGDKVSGEDCREGLTCVISVKLTNAQFEGQTKAKLGNSEIRTLVDGIVSDRLMQFLEENPVVARTILDKAMTANRAREAARKARESIRRKSALGGAAIQAENEKHLGAENIRNNKLPVLHFVLMGLPVQSDEGYGQYGDGGWLIFTTSFDSPQARDAALRQKFIDRAYTLAHHPDMLLSSLSRKNLSTFGRGTFELNEIFEADEHEPNNALKQVVFAQGRWNRAYTHLATALFLAQMLLACIACAQAVHRRDTSAAPLFLTLLGAFLFLCIWETRARYFFQFMMVLLCAGAMFAPKRAD